MILVDTPIWSFALRRRRRDLDSYERLHVQEWRRLVRSGMVVLIGPVRQELLSGVREQSAWDKLRTALRPFPDLPIRIDDYERAASMYNRCQRRGVAASAVDVLICSLASGHGLPIYTTDSDFDRYAEALDLRLHSPT